MNKVLTLDKVTKSFVQADTSVEVLKGISLELAKGEVVALLGASGSGKTTLLQITGLLSKPTSGAVSFQGNEASKASDAALTQWRNSDIGFVYQFHHLLPEFTAQENVALPHILSGASRAKAMEKALNMLKELGLEHRALSMPSTLSGGEQQRVSIARALINDPSVLIADEPTGNLDDDTSEKVFKLLLEMVKQRGMAALIATHNTDLATRMSRVLRLEGGVIVNAS